MSISNLEKYRKDLDALISESSTVSTSLLKQAYGAEFEELILKQQGMDKTKAKKELDSIKPFVEVYHHWYSEALILVKQLLPDRLADFIRLYERPKTRKELSHDTYRIEDACQGLVGRRGGEVTVSLKTAVNLLDQQIAIVESIKRRFESSLFDIKQLVQADLFDSELGAARELLKNKFTRGSGAIAGVVLEGHLAQVCENHAVKLTKKNPSISDYNQALKDANVIETAQWRFHQHLGDIRNKCDHSKTDEPTVDEVKDFIDGVAKVIKTVF